jgi:transcriptional regulator with XRE-family HTH domain
VPEGISLGERLRALRHDVELTLAATSYRAEISVGYLNDIEHDRTVPTLARLQQIAAVFDMSVREVLRGVSPYDFR